VDEYTLFVQPSDPLTQQWEGTRTNVESACEHFGATRALSNKHFTSELTQLIKRVERVYMDHPPNDYGFQSATLSSHYKNHNISKYVEQMRLIKSPAEQAVMKQAGDAMGRSITQAMKATLESEAWLESLLSHGMVQHGGAKFGYVPVVAGGSNALVLHYVANNCLLKQGEMVLVDAGANVGGYVSDISRTWPIDAAFTSAQRDLYQAVLNVQKSSIKACNEASGHSLESIHKEACVQLQRELRNLSFDASLYDIHSTLFPHHIGHYLGLDVHDTPSISRSIALQQGMVVTMEPGIYVPYSDKYPRHFQGMGIRIEDDVLVQPDYPIVLSSTAPKEVADIEALRRAKTL
jgi:intermediate cleaving peptidase 55